MGCSMAKARIGIPSNIEPSWTDEEVAPQIAVIEAMNWYSSNKTEKDAAKILKCEAKIAKNHTTYAWSVRMRERGFKFAEKTEESIANLKAAYDAAVAANNVPDVDEEGNPVTENVVNLQERILTKTNYHIGELEGVIDDYGYEEKPFNAYDWFTKNGVKPIHANRIAEYFRDRAAKLIDEVKNYPEYYAAVPKSKIKSILAVCVSIVQDAERLSSNVTKARKPRKKKTISIEKQVAKLKYLISDNNFKIKSIDPVNVIGADQIWVFNVKSRKLGVYIASDRDGIRVKGSAFVNYEEKTSISKTLRKPEKILTSVLDGGKITLRKLMDSINSKAAPLNGRINKDTILLRAVR